MREILCQPAQVLNRAVAYLWSELFENFNLGRDLQETVASRARLAHQDVALIWLEVEIPWRLSPLYFHSAELYARGRCHTCRWRIRKAVSDRILARCEV